jgi:hypothetical protein
MVVMVRQTFIHHSFPIKDEEESKNNTTRNVYSNITTAGANSSGHNNGDPTLVHHKWNKVVVRCVLLYFLVNSFMQFLAVLPTTRFGKDNTV